MLLARREAIGRSALLCFQAFQVVFSGQAGAAYRSSDDVTTDPVRQLLVPPPVVQDTALLYRFHGVCVQRPAVHVRLVVLDWLPG